MDYGRRDHPDRQSQGQNRQDQRQFFEMPRSQLDSPQATISINIQRLSTVVNPEYKIL